MLGAPGGELFVIGKRNKENLLRLSMLKFCITEKDFRPQQELAVNPSLKAFKKNFFCYLFLVSFSLFLVTIGINSGESSLGVYPGEGDLDSEVSEIPFI